VSPVLGGVTSITEQSEAEHEQCCSQCSRKGLRMQELGALGG
jgi:hypothetical protein